MAWVCLEATTDLTCILDPLSQVSFDASGGVSSATVLFNALQGA